MTDRKFLCQYAVVQFAPYRMTGEFVNVGIVLLWAERAFFGFKLQHGELRRVSDFFPGLPMHIYRQSMLTLRDELVHIGRVFQARKVPQPELALFMNAAFSNLVLKHETVVRFGAARGLKTDDPAMEVSRQYNLPVDRSYFEPGPVPYFLE